MIELLDLHPPVAVPDSEYLRLLGYPPGHTPGARARELAGWAREWFGRHGRPWVYFREAALDAADGVLRLDGREFRSGQLRDHLLAAGATRAVLVAVSAGRAAEEEARRRWEDARPDEYFFLEIFGSAVVEHLVATLSGRLCDAAARDGLMAVPHYSPGYAGWDVADQGRLFELITSRQGPAFPEPLEVLASGMLRPKKSLLAVFGLTPRTEAALRAPQLSPCESCAFSPCVYRRAPYRHVAVRIDGAPPPPPAAAPRYSVAAKALRKWAAERVRLEPADGGATIATFRFEGTTCSNMGRPLAFDYRVRLGAAAERWPILEAGCAPAPGDQGHRLMCAYLSNATGLMQAIEAERPLVGQPLEAVLSWSRPAAPSGCFCEAKSRAHKWGLALETIHFALNHARPASALPPAACLG